MAIIEVKVPQLSESVAEATLLDWHKKEGEPVKRDENLIDIETDKVVLELPAPADGVLVEDHQEGDATSVGSRRRHRPDRHGGEGRRPRRPRRAAKPAAAPRQPAAASRQAPVMPAAAEDRRRAGHRHRRSSRAPAATAA